MLIIWSNIRQIGKNDGRMAYNLVIMAYAIRILSSRLLLACVVACFALPTISASALELRITGHTDDGRLSFRGVASISLVTFHGRITGKRNDDVQCKGQSTFNIFTLIVRARMKCTDGISAKIRMKVKSLEPIIVEGSGKLSDGRSLSARAVQ